jgi:hypothetical protein
MPGAEGDLELLAKEQVLDGQGLTAADGGDEGGQDEPVEFEHLGKSPITTRDRLAGRTFAPLQVGVQSAFVNSLHKLAMCFRHYPRTLFTSSIRLSIRLPWSFGSSLSPRPFATSSSARLCDTLSRCSSPSRSLPWSGIHGSRSGARFARTSRNNRTDD